MGQITKNLLIDLVFIVLYAGIVIVGVLRRVLLIFFLVEILRRLVVELIVLHDHIRAHIDELVVEFPYPLHSLHSFHLHHVPTRLDALSVNCRLFTRLQHT